MHEHIYNKFNRSVCTWVRDSTGKITHCNEQFAVSVGYESAQSLIGTNIDEIFSFEHARKLLQFDAELVMEGLPVSKVEKLEAKTTQKTIYYYSYSIPIPEQESVHTLSQILSDSGALDFESNISWHDILDNLPGHVYWFDVDNKFLGCNQKQAATFKLHDPNEIVGRSVYEFETKRDADHIIKINNAVMKHRKAFIVEELYTDESGKVSTYLSRKAPLYNLKGELIGVLGISLDITAEKENQKLKHENEVAEKLAKTMSTIAAALAHDLPAPIAIIKQSASILTSDLEELVSGYRAAVNEGIIQGKIRERVLDRYKELGEVFLNQIKIIENDVDVTMENLKQKEISTHRFENVDSMATAILSAVDNFAFRPGERELLSFDLEDDFCFFGDLGGIRHIMYNLLKNALYFIQVARKGNIKISLDTSGDINLIRFIDTGAGAGKDVVKNMFTPYFSERDTGAGIGLAFCAKMVDAMGGTIFAEAEIGEYMEIFIELPKLKSSMHE